MWTPSPAGPRRPTSLTWPGYEEINEQEYNLSVSTYVEAEDSREQIDIVQLNAEIAQIVAREDALRAEIDKIIAEIEVDA